MSGSSENDDPDVLEAQEAQMSSETQGALNGGQAQVIREARHATGGLEPHIFKATDKKTTAGVAAAEKSQDPLGLGLPGPQDGGVIPTPGFTSAFYYDPYVEIKDFLDALKSGANFGVVADDGPNVLTGKLKTREAANGNPSESQPNESAIHPESAVATQELASEAIVSASLTPETSSSTDPAIKSRAAAALEEKKPVVEALDPGTNQKTEGAAWLETRTGIESEDAVESSSENAPLVAAPQSTSSEASHGSAEQQNREGSVPNQVKQGLVTSQQATSTDATQPSAAADESPDKETLSFAASITASFAPQTKSAWAQLFGSRYEDEIESRATCVASTSSTSRDMDQSPEEGDRSETRLSLKAKLERERKLDQQIQASQQRFKERSLRSEPQSHTLTRSQQSPKRHINAAAPIPLKPFEMAGLSITSVRFCLEKALQATCKCFQQLHALVLNEPQMPKGEAEHGVFVSQWELELLLQELFGPPREGSGGTAAAPSSLGGFALANPMYTGVPLELLLQITWFIPFDQLARLRSLVLQITRKHLNEHKLAVLNRHLQKQLLLIPYSTRLQQVLLQFSGHRVRHDNLDEPHDNEDDLIPSTGPPLAYCTSALVRELLECIAAPVPTEPWTTLGDKDFLLLSPFELVQKWRLSSLLCIQRVIFFRFLVEAIASERSPSTSESVTTQKKSERLKSSSLRAPQSVRSVQSRTKATTASSAVSGSKQTTTKKKVRPKAKRTSSSSGDSESENSMGSSKSLNISRSSITALHGSTASAASSNANEYHELPNYFASIAKEDQIDEQLHRLQQKLHLSLGKLGEVMPWLHHSNELDSSAIRATFLAASAFHQSLDIMIRSHLALDCDITDKLQHFVDAIDALIAAGNESPASEPPVLVARQKLLSHPAVAAATTLTRSDSALSQSGKFPPPFPDLTRDEEKARFPPPYESMGASYWAFTPNLPTSQLAASVAKSSKPSMIYSSLYPTQPSPGVGSYDIQRGEQITFQQKPGYSFRKAGIGVGDVGHTPGKELIAASPSSATATPNKPRIHKGNAFVRPSSPAVLPQTNVPESLDHEPSHHSAGVEIKESVSKLHSQNDDGDNDDDEYLQVDILNALRRQHNMVVNDFMNDIMLQNHQPSQLSPPEYDDLDPNSLPVRAKATHSRRGKASLAAVPQQKWRSSSESRFVKRIRGRDVDATPSSPVTISRHTTQHEQEQQTSRKHSSLRPQSARAPVKPVPTKDASPVKPRSTKQPQLSKSQMKMPLANGHEQPNDEHLAWAARTSDFYRAKQSLNNDDE